MKTKKAYKPPKQSLQIDGPPPGAGKPARGRTVILRTRGNPEAKHWVEWLDKNCQASTGPYGNLTGMRNLYWGKEALVVRAGAYLYLITRKDDGRRMPWEGRC